MASFLVLTLNYCPIPPTRKAEEPYIIPSEFLNSDYGVEVKRALIQSNTLHHIIIVDFKECAFDDALTTACILLCERNEKPNNVRFSLVEGIDMLHSSLEKYVEYNGDELEASIKWKAYYEENNCRKYNNGTLLYDISFKMITFT